MKVEELIIDGFKSYAARTVISGWDSSFNCITGLNGSGKSNILDAICFVLGITTMSTVRAQNLQDLIYKRGQAGVTKASVTIVFDNSDRATSPIGFEDQAKISVTRQVILGGTNKFLINGHRAQQQNVQQLFQSVQLNINNPNFLIMQGRITKVLNMKPAEILSLIEEAAGTWMFNDRREKAIKTMTKKQMKVEEIMGLLNDEIEPKLEKLRSDKRTFLDYQQVQGDYERATKLVGSYDYVHHQQRLHQHQSELGLKRQEVTNLKASVEKASSEIKILTEELSTLRANREAQLQKGGKFQALEKQLKSLSQESARVSTLADLKNNNILDEEKKRQEVQKNLETLELKVSQRMAQFNALEAAYNDANQQLEELSAEYSKKEELLQSLLTGVSSKDGGIGSGYEMELQTARQMVSNSTTIAAQAQVRIGFLEKQISDQKSRVREAKAQGSELKAKITKMQLEYDALNAQMEASGWQPEKETQLKQRQSELEHEIRALTGQAESLSKRVGNIEFNYTKPSRDFDVSQVKGVVAQLFSIDKENYNAATALEICAGGRLFNVVVDNDNAAAQLLSKGQIKRRVTIIPLNKISAFKLSAEKLGAAQKIAPGKVDLALNLIGYDQEVQTAMEFVFGSTLVCKDAETAKRVAFNPNVRTRTVTLEGDVYDPMGTLSGGSTSSSDQSEGTLATIQKLNELNASLARKQSDLQDIVHRLSVETNLATQLQSVKKTMDLKEHEIKLANKSLDSSPQALILKKYEEAVQEIAELQSQIATAQSEQEQGRKDMARIEKDMNEFKSNKGSKLQQLKSEVIALKQTISEKSKEVKERLTEFQTSQIEIEQFGGDITALKEQLVNMQEAVQEMKDSLVTLRNQWQEFQSQEAKVSAELDGERKSLIGLDEELESLENTLKAKNELVTEGSLKMQQITHESEQLSKEVETFNVAISRLEQEYDWIKDQKQ